MSRAGRFTRLPKSEYPASIHAAIAIAETTIYPLPARINALAHLRAFNPESIPLRPAIIAELDAGRDCVQ